MNKQIKELANGIKYVCCDLLSYGDYDNSTEIERANVRYLKSNDELKDSIDTFSMNEWEKGTKDRFAYREPIESDSKLIETYGGYSSIQLWVREDIWNEMELDSLEDYLILDDDMASTVEMELEDESWDNCYKSDLIRTLPDELEDDELEFHCLWCGYDGTIDQLEIVLDRELCPECKHNTIKRYPNDKKTLREFADELNDDTIREIYEYCKEKTNTNGCVEPGGNWYIDIDQLQEEFKKVIEQYYNGNQLCDNCRGTGKMYISWCTKECDLCNETGFVIANKETESEIEKEN